MPQHHLDRIAELEALPAREGFEQSGYLYFQVLKELTAGETTSFPNHYTRLVFLERNGQISAETARSARWLGLQWRGWKDDPTSFTPTPRITARAIDCIRSLIVGGPSFKLDADEPPTAIRPAPAELLRCVFLEKIDVTTLLCSAEETGTFRLLVPEAFHYITPLLWPMVRLNLIRPRHLQDANFTIQDTGFIILEPDILVAATTLANLTAGGPQPRLHFCRLLQPLSVKDSFFRGNLVNRALDDILLGHTPDPEQIAAETLAQEPAYALCLNPQTYAAITRGLQTHITNLDHPHIHQLAASDHVSLEPVFISPTFGLRGRLDALDHPPAEAPTIVELKSSKLPKNRHLRESDELQALVYSLIIEGSTLGQARSVNILYSATRPEDASSPLRALAAGHREQAKVLKLRNQIIYLERMMAESPRRLFEGHDPKRCGDGHYEDTVNALHDLREDWNRAPELVRAFVAEFTGFLAREQRCTWLGGSGDRSTGGLSRSWNSPRSSLQRNGYLIADLEFDHMTDNTSLHFRLPQNENQSESGDLFSPGASCVLYAAEDSQDPTAGQRYKCRVMNRSESLITLQPLFPVSNPKHFRQGIWNIGTDIVAYGFSQSLASVRDVLATGAARDRYLGITAPSPPVPANVTDEHCTEHQRHIVSLAAGAPDFFLVQGPPGTGKTRHVIRALVNHLRHDKAERLICLAYTNRAVFEIASTLQSAGIDFLLKSHSAPTELHAHTLSQRAQGADLETLSNIIHNSKIILSTTSTWLNSRTFWSLGFTTAIIDEASQLLEPHVAGILCAVPRFILIGDQNQLPAVVTQAPKSHAIESPELSRHFHSLAESVFARLWRQAQSEDWPVTAQLTEQGRMHQTIMAFPSEAFYEGTLRTMRPEQSSEQAFRCHPSPRGTPDAIDELLARHRVVFFNLPTTPDRLTNHIEAKWIAEFVTRLLRDGVPASEIGVICPYRSQIQTIRKALSAHPEMPPEVESLTIDTVERYQGSSRQIILVSFTISHPEQLSHLQSLDEKGTVDRKLNVALTRAREQLFLLGHRPTLESGSAYQKLFEWLDSRGLVFEPEHLCDR